MRGARTSSPNFQAEFPQAGFTKPTYIITHDGQVHNPLGAGGYFVPTITKPLADASEKSVVIHIGAQPNNSPHTGTITVFALAFARAKQMRDADPSIDVTVSLDLVDTAPDSSKTMDLDGVKYQQSHRATAAMNQFLPDYEELMVGLSAHFGDVKWRKTFQREQMDADSVPAILRWILGNHAWLGPRLAPQRKKLCIRSACPHEECAWADKHGINTTFLIDGTFMCPYHGQYVVDLSKKEDVRRLEFNTPLRNLVRTIAQGLHTRSVRATSDAAVLHMRVTGADYSGMYQERLLWSVLMQLRVPIDPPMIVYAPLIVDWAGSKLSKSLYVKKGAYRYLEDKDMHYLLSYDNMKAMKKDPMALARMIEGLLDDEGAMERPYSIDYIHTFVFDG
ncbi:hypothetical protein BDZ89DRAFT_946021 [Hymenopellis radicata]|nr:hypothetical protein BDZ89DRAFT_946021 [Hymenopellis radicata]